MITHYSDEELQNLGKGISRGPWWACCSKEPDGEAHFIFGCNGDISIARPFDNDPNYPDFEPLEYPVTKSERRANARLLAASPSLLEDVVTARMERDLLLHALQEIMELEYYLGQDMQEIASQAVQKFRKEHIHIERDADMEEEK